MALRIASRFVLASSLATVDTTLYSDPNLLANPYDDWLANFIDSLGAANKKQVASECFSFFAAEGFIPRYLVKNHKADPNHQISYRTPLHFAGMKGNSDVIIPIVNVGGKIDAKDDMGCTPLFYALLSRKTTCAEEMIRCGATADQACPADWSFTRNKVIHFADQDSFWKSPLCLEQLPLSQLADSEAHFWKSYCLYTLIISKGPVNVDAVKKLLQEGASVSVLIGAATTLHVAASLRSPKILELLLGKNRDSGKNDDASVDIKDAFGWTPLMYAIQSGNKAAVEFLDQRHARFDFESAEGTPLDLTERCNIDTFDLQCSKDPSKILPADPRAEFKDTDTEAQVVEQKQNDLWPQQPQIIIIIRVRGELTSNLDNG
ncbi:ankyrin repeat and SOCS box protein 13-like isoform X2 [Oscarella lobularis]|uniref:ankyrin repeat and SOCS box protein 13-like isoform X2 n=1 Tax=Oscarella lobularis TaxID=121494 RepID=UPI003313475B